MRSLLSAAIVAGGRARRLGGADKSRLVVGGRPIIVRQLAVLQSVAEFVFMAGAEPSRYGDLGIPAYPDVVPGAGALGGLLTALTAASTDRVVVVGCDLPFLSAPLLERLATLAQSHQVAWVCGEHGPEPLLACYQRAILPRVRERIDRGRLAVRDLALDVSVAAVDATELAQFGDPARLVYNVNTFDDYRRVQYADS